MRVTVRFLGHSGFTVSEGQRLLVFDTAMGRDPRREVLRAVQPTVFVSHAHRDHFDPRIYAWRRLHPAIRYVLSNEVPGPEEARRLAPGDLWEHQGLRVRAVPSTEKEWPLSRIRRHPIFHAGDLNDWHWRSSPPPPRLPPPTKPLRYFGNPQRRGFRHRLLSGGSPHGRRIRRRARAFCRALRPAHFFPMHFSRRFDVPADFRRWALDACPSVNVHDILREGQTFVLELNAEEEH